MAGPVPFVGRASALSRLLTALEGDARLVMVVGDAGVGKTRFVAEGMAGAAAAGMVTACGECLPLAETLPLLPVAAALTELSRLDGGALMNAAVASAPAYVQAEVGRLVPGLSAVAGPGPRDEARQRDRLFSAVAELLAEIGSAAARLVVLVIEDVQWADSATLDLLTFLARAGHGGLAAVVVTCRSDEAPLDGRVADWLAHVRGAAWVEEIRLGPLSRPEVARQVAALTGVPVSPETLDALYARAEGNPFFTEQLVAAGRPDGTDGPAESAGELPGRLAELLAARTQRCTSVARAVLAGLAVTGRPLDEDVLVAITGLDLTAARGGLRELAAGRLLAEDSAGERYRPRHRLVAEVVVGELLPGERHALHERAARALAAAGDDQLAAEIAGHWQAAGNPAGELPARVLAAEVAERLFGYAEAAVHWQRAIELGQAQPAVIGAAGTDVPGLYLRAVDALRRSGAEARAGLVAEEACHLFASHADPAVAAAVRHRAASLRRADNPAAGLELIEEALRLYEHCPPSADYAEALLDYAVFLLYAQSRSEEALAALNQALEVAEAAGATALVPRIFASLAADALRRGQLEQGFAFLDRGWARARDDGVARISLVINRYIALFWLARLEEASQTALRGLEDARRVGLGASWWATLLAFNAAEAMAASGRTAEAGALIDPLTTGAPGRDDWVLHEMRAEIDMLRGDTAAAADRRDLIGAVLGHLGSADYARESAQRAAELSLWAGRPGDALAEVRQALGLFKTPVLTIFCGRLLTTGMRACADLAEQARARRDESAARQAVAAAADLASWVDQLSAAPFTDHPSVATIPAERATWEAERTRLAGASDHEAWHAAAATWQDLGCPHRAGYAWWRQAEACLDAGLPSAAATALRAAAASAAGHEPLLARIRALAERARVPLSLPAAVQVSPPDAMLAPYGLTARELAVLRLVATGRTNAQIGAELYISPRTAGVHVTNILRKLGVSSRVQAAAQAERAGLLEARQS